MYYCLGSLPAIFIIESIMEHVGEALGIPAETVKQKNLYEKGQVSQILVNIVGYTYLNQTSLYGSLNIKF